MSSISSASADSASVSASASEPPLNSSQSIPILLITDIGRDCDDLFALILLRNFCRKTNKIPQRQIPLALVAAVTSGANSLLRLKLLRFWLKILQFNKKIPTSATEREIKEINSKAGGVFIHRGMDKFPLPDTEFPIEPDLFSLFDRIFHESSSNPSSSPSLIVYIIGPLTPLADYIRARPNFNAKQCIKQILIQGQIENLNQFLYDSSSSAVENNDEISINHHHNNNHINDNNHNNIINSNSASNSNFDSNSNTSIQFPQSQHHQIEFPLLIPSPLSFNFHCDFPSADFIFQQLSLKIPFFLLGKFAAYKIPMHYNQLFTNINTNNTNENMIYHIETRLKEEIYGCMNLFYSTNPLLFEKLYFIPQQNGNSINIDTSTSTTNASNNDDNNTTNTDTTNNTNTTDNNNHNDMELFFSRLHCISHPYDPLLLYSWRFIDEFHPIMIQKQINSPSYSSHILIGMNENTTGILDFNIESIQLKFCSIIKEEIKFMAAAASATTTASTVADK